MACNWSTGNYYYQGFGGEGALVSLLRPTPKEEQRDGQGAGAVASEKGGRVYPRGRMGFVRVCQCALQFLKRQSISAFSWYERPASRNETQGTATTKTHNTQLIHFCSPSPCLSIGRFVFFCSAYWVWVKGCHWMAICASCVFKALCILFDKKRREPD